MGYNTEYSLEVRNVQTKEDFDMLTDALKEMGVIYYALDSGHYYAERHRAYFDPWSPVKWSEHTETMTDVSMLFSDMVFCLSGVGEMNEDLWNEYYKAGASEFCPAEIVYPLPTEIDWDEVECSA